jgi:hypothetical protein
MHWLCSPTDASIDEINGNKVRLSQWFSLLGHREVEDRSSRPMSDATPRPLRSTYLQRRNLERLSVPRALLRHLETRRRANASALHKTDASLQVSPLHQVTAPSRLPLLQQRRTFYFEFTTTRETLTAQSLRRPFVIGGDTHLLLLPVSHGRMETANRMAEMTFMACLE